MNIEKMYSLKDRLCDELMELSEQGLNMQNLETMDRLARTIKNIHKLIMLEDAGGYSGDGDWMARGSYGRSYGGGSYGMGRGSIYTGERGYSGDGDMMMDDHGASYQHRDSMGRYSRSDSREVVMENLRKMRDNAKDNSERSAIAKVMNQMNAMR